MSDQAHGTDRLSEYIDGGLNASDRAAVERHLEACPECARVVDELRAVVAEAGRLPETPPIRDLWPGIHGRLTARRARPAQAEKRRAGADALRLRSGRRFMVTVPQLLAAGIAVAVLSASGAWAALGGGRGADIQAPPVTAEVTTPSGAMLAAYQPAMTDLEMEYERRRAELDPETIQVVERNLAIIDAAIQEASHALAADPSSGFLHSRLADAMRMRMNLLRQASSI